jgi:hypothetical protein
MNIAKRFGFYGFGFIIGLFLLFFFLSGKKTSCDYGPEARTLKDIRIKERVFLPEVLITLENNSLDTSAISSLLKQGNVLFSESNTKLDSCKMYVIEGIIQEKKIKMMVKNCNKTATVTSVITQ